MGRVSDTTKERIRERIDMVALVSEYVSLQQRGSGDFWGRCPFHEERSASFHILPGKGLFKCFGCGKGGDVFRFVEEIEGIRFPDALRRLAERAGVTIEDASPQERAREARRAELLRASAIVAEFYAEVLASATPVGERGRAYLTERGIAPETAQAFGLGVAPPDWDGLAGVARARGIDEEILLELGLLRRGKGGAGRPYAFFRDRLMFPIRNVQDKVVAFGGRTLVGDERKYMNSPEVPGLYEKRKLLYGLDLSRKARPKRLVVVEGYMDVVIPHQANHPEFVAALGTAFTLEQAALARRYVDEVVLLFDADEAGAGATLRALANLVGIDGLTVRVARLPDGLDPDEAVRADPALLEAALSGADDLLSFIIDQTMTGYSLASPAGQERAVRAAIKLLIKIPDRIRLFRELQSISARFGLPEDVLRQELSSADVEARRSAARRQQTASSGEGWRGEPAGRSDGPGAARRGGSSGGRPAPGGGGGGWQRSQGGAGGSRKGGSGKGFQKGRGGRGRGDWGGDGARGRGKGDWGDKGRGRGRFEPPPPPPAPGGLPELEVHALEALLWEPQAAAEALAREAGPGLFTPGPTQRVAAAIFSAAPEGPIEPARVMGRLEEPEDRALCETLIGRYDEGKRYDDTFAALAELRRKRLQERLKFLNRRMAEADQQGRKDITSGLLAEHAAVQRELRSAAGAASAGAEVR